MTATTCSVGNAARARRRTRSYACVNTLFWKYVALFLAVVCAALLSNGLFEIIFSYREHTDALVRTQREQAQGAAEKIGLSSRRSRARWAGRRN
jgi:hypothetical protein